MNYKKIGLATLALAVVWFGMDFVIHGMWLMDQYKMTPQLWRPIEEMNHVVGIAMTVIFALLFVLFYAKVVRPKNLSTGVQFGIWYGLLGGFAMASSYSYLPISEMLAACWFASVFVESLVGGAIVGWIMKEG